MAATLHVFAVKDSAIQAFGTPFFLPTNNVAIRSFSDEVNRSAPDNNLFHHPSDFTLYELGVFDADSGLFHAPEGGPSVLARAQDLKTS